MSYQCFTCERSFVDEIAITQHADALRHSKFWSCDVCEEYFWNPEDLNQHSNEQHTVRESVREYHCEDCDRSFPTWWARKNHYDNANAHKLVCEVCNKPFQFKNAVLQHTIAVHPAQCLTCFARFGNETQMQAHVDFHHGHPCGHCSSRFCYKSELNRHLWSHGTPCDECSKAFSTSAMLEEHQQSTHSLPCKQCDLTFKDGEALAQHELTHAYKCRLCEKFFDTPAGCFLHEVKHAQFTCPLCAVWTGSQEELLQHHKVHHTFPCSKCDARFDTAVGLEDHTSSAHNMMCDVCDRKFSTFADVQEHWFECHGHMSTEPPKTPSAQILSRVRDTEIKKERDRSPDSMVISCPVCKEQCRSPERFIQHHADKHIMKCLVCEAVFENESALFKHGALCQVPELEPDSSSLTAFESPRSFHALSHIYPQASIEPVKIAVNTAPGYINDSVQDNQRKSTDWKHAATQTAVYRCHPCNAFFDTEKECLHHLEFSPLHQERTLDCRECGIKFVGQVELLRHIESKPHKTRWILCMSE